MRWCDLGALAITMVVACGQDDATPHRPPPDLPSETGNGPVSPSSDTGVAHTAVPVACERATIEERAATGDQKLFERTKLVYTPGVDNGWNAQWPLPPHPEEWMLPAGRLVDWTYKDFESDRGHATYRHDLAGRLVSYETDLGWWRWAYDSDGLMVQYENQFDPSLGLKSVTLVATYDEAGVLVRTDRFENEAPYSVTDYAYDDSGTTTATVDYAARAGSVDERWRWKYDEAGRLEQWGYVSEQIGAEAHWLTYDEAGRLAQDRRYTFFLWATWWCERWSYDEAGRPVRLLANNFCGDAEEEGYFVYDYAYDDEGHQTLWEWSNSEGYPFERWTWTYDDLGRRSTRFVQKTWGVYDRYRPVQRDTWTYEEDVPCPAADDASGVEGSSVAPPSAPSPRVGPTFPTASPPLPSSIGGAAPSRLPR